MNDQKNTILAVVLSALVLIGWQYFFAVPQQKQRQEELQRQAPITQVRPSPEATPGQTPDGAPTPPAAAPQVPPQSGASAAVGQKSRGAIIESTARVAIDTPRIKGSIALKGGRIDDVSLAQYHETVDPSSPAIVLLSPSESPHPFYAEFGWISPAGGAAKVPGSDTIWQRQGSGTLGIGRPITLSYDNGEGLTFRRTISVDDKYLFTVKDEVTNNSAAPVTLYPYGLIARHGKPQTANQYYILHEGMIGVLGDQGLQEVKYNKIEEKKELTFKATNAWLGITDKYWAATLLPDTDAQVQARFSADDRDAVKNYQTD